MDALDAALDDARQLHAQHRSLTQALLGGTFSGTARATFEADVSAAVTELTPGATADVEASRAWLVQEIRAARQRQDAYEDDLSAWQHRADAAVPS